MNTLRRHTATLVLHATRHSSTDRHWNHIEARLMPSRLLTHAACVMRNFQHSGHYSGTSSATTAPRDLESRVMSVKSRSRRRAPYTTTNGQSTDPANPTGVRSAASGSTSITVWSCTCWNTPADAHTSVRRAASRTSPRRTSSTTWRPFTRQPIASSATSATSRFRTRRATSFTEDCTQVQLTFVFFPWLMECCRVDGTSSEHMLIGHPPVSVDTDVSRPVDRHYRQHYKHHRWL